MTKIMTKRILVITAWYPSPQKPFSTVFVRDQIQILNKYFNTFDSETKYTFCVLHIGFPIDLANFYFRKKRTENLIEFSDAQSVQVIHRQSLIISHRFDICNNYFIDNSLKDGWNAATLALNGMPDTIIAVTLSGLINAQRLLSIFNMSIPIVLHEHSNPLSMHFPTEKRKKLAISALGITQEIVIVAKRQLEEFDNLINNITVKLIHNPAKQDFFESLIKQKQQKDYFTLVNVGHLNVAKAQDKLIQAVHRLINKYNLKLIIIGEGENRDKLSNLVKELKLEKFVTFTGGLNSGQIIDILQNSDLFILSSIYENCPVALIEAQAIGLPCVCTINNGSEHILIKGNGIAVEQDENGINIANGIEKIIYNLDNYDKKAIRQRTIEQYSPKVFAENFYNIINKYIQ